MKVIHDPIETRSHMERIRHDGKRVGFVPTMGALHEGHLALVREAKKRADEVLVSVFVNPTQFGPNEDFARYPRDLDGDVKKVQSAGATIVFAPEATAMYPEGEATRVRVSGLTDHLCGPFRPGHFEGVATVVTKLFSISGACVAVFGRKDFQQLQVIERMVRDLFLPIEIVGHPIVREADGLAMSSRNAYLSAEERTRALSLSRGLFSAAKAFQGGEKRAGALMHVVRSILQTDSIDYVTIADPEKLVPIEGDEEVTRAVLAIAARIGKTRLIDNFVLGEDTLP